MDLLRLVWRNLWRRKLRTFLTVGSLVVAFFLLCTLRTLVTTIQSGADAASASRLIVQSAVSLFVDLPQSYQTKIQSVPGIEGISKWQWFGGYYQEERNRFAQFAVDPAETLEIYPEMQITEGSAEAFEKQRRGALIGTGLVEKYGWKLGDTVPILPELFPHPDGPGIAWEFEVAAIYEPTARNFDPNMMMFHWDYFEDTVKAGSGEAPGVGTYILALEPGADPTAVMGRVDALFENGPQRVQTTSESEFQKQFVSMFGNVPFFVSAIGGGVLIAILLAVVNTMLMAGREQTRDIGILKALGFTDGDAVKLLALQSMLICLVGAGLGLLLAQVTEPGIAGALGSMFPGYAVTSSTYALGAVVAVGLGLFAGIAPAWRAARLDTVQALSAKD
ncbi:Macrolide export ATP-binding/permease protein MacB [Planctomycetes bacterium Poly30]|uniref:Macrolide export ATP-binding/permease protein MacB n=1 Tax=Saltatorellus ferox TaxID=2528018 RepID=A0A518F0M8_9BACT|nr:Macrolide export ATP-binding/permease protein MacB [Planctomycetes bacterium Poly30]